MAHELGKAPKVLGTSLGLLQGVDLDTDNLNVSINFVFANASLIFFL